MESMQGGEDGIVRNIGEGVRGSWRKPESRRNVGHKTRTQLAPALGPPYPCRNQPHQGFTIPSSHSRFGNASPMSASS